MPRKNIKKQERNEIKWIKRGGGSFRAKIKGKDKIIKPNETFHATIEEIPQNFRDTIEPVDPDQVQEVNTAEPNANVGEEDDFGQSEYIKKHVGGGWYDVFDSEENQMNETKLKAEDADQLIKELEG